jgi:predicted DNA-binding transcriptional regulator AlpA
MSAAPLTIAEPIPHVCTIADICRVLNISRPKFYVLRAEGKFPIPELLPKLGRGPRFAGEMVRQYLAGKAA